MSQSERIVVGYQGGSTGADALEFGRRWALSSGDEVVVVTVHPGSAPIGPARVDAEWVAYEREEADRLLEEAGKLLGGDVRASFQRIDAGSAAHGLHDLCELGGTLVALGARRDHALRRTFPGSTAERLLQGSALPVAMVPWGYAEKPAEPLRTVMVAFVDTPDGRVALEHATRMAAHLAGRLRVLAVIPDTRVVPAMGEPRVFAVGQRDYYRSALDAAVESARSAAPGLEVAGDLVEGPVVEALTELGPDDGDLLVIGSRGYGPIRRVLPGGVANRVVRHARVPVAVVPRGAG